MSEKLVVELIAKVEGAVKDLKEVKEAVEGIKDTAEESAKSLKGIKKATEILKKGFKGVGLAIKAMGVGLALEAFTKLQEAFQQNQTTADAFAKIGVVLQGVFNGLIKIAEPLIELLGDLFTKPRDTIKELLDNVKNFAKFAYDQLIGRVLNGLERAFLNVGVGVGKVLKTINKLLGRNEAVAHFDKEIAKNQERIAELQDKQVKRNEDLQEVVQGVRDKAKEVTAEFTEAVKKTAENAETLKMAESEMRRMEIAQQKILEQKDREAEQQRQIRDDIRLGLEERIAANEELGKILMDQANAEKETIQGRIGLLKLQQEVLGFNRDRANEILALENELLAVDSKIIGMQSEQRMNEASLQQEKADRLALEQEGALELSRIEEDGLAEREQNEIRKLQMSLDRIEAERAAEEKLLKEKQALYAEDTVQYQEFQNQIDVINKTAKQNELNLETQIAQQKMSVMMDSLGSLRSAIGENTKAGKALGIAEAVINTYVGATQALKNPFPLNIVALASTLASGFASVRAITAVDETGETSPDMGGVSAPTMTGPSVSLSAGGIDPNTQLLGALNETASRPSRAYVVGQDVTSQQAMDRRRLENATL